MGGETVINSLIRDAVSIQHNFALIWQRQHLSMGAPLCKPKIDLVLQDRCDIGYLETKGFASKEIL